MNKLEERVISEGLIFKGIRGSVAYGTNIEGSDTDYVGVYIQRDSDITGLNYIPQISSENNDDVYYELRRFLELAMNGNPNILEVFNLPLNCVIFTTPSFELLRYNHSMFLTKNLYNTFAGYAKSQIKKAKGLNKKINWEKSRIERKSVLDFCYVLDKKEESVKLEEWLALEKLDVSNMGLAKVNNFPDIYSMYFVGEGGGIANEDSNDVQLRNIKKHDLFMKYLRFDKNAYSTHCKDYREYVNWVDKRNELRFNTNQAHGKDYDSKNMMHCLRLLGMSIDIALGNGVIVRRPPMEIDLLKSVRRGEYSYEQVLNMAEKREAAARELFNESDLPTEVDKNKVHLLINSIRRTFHAVQTI